MLYIRIGYNSTNTIYKIKYLVKSIYLIFFGLSV
jgi:hypothetical protein